MSIFASFLLLLLILVEAAPPTASSVPVLGVYYCFNLVIIMMAVFLSTLVVNICRAGEGTKPVPRWLKMLTIDFLSRLFCMRDKLFTNDEFNNLTPEESTLSMSNCRRPSTGHCGRSSSKSNQKNKNQGAADTSGRGGRDKDLSHISYMPIPNGSTGQIVQQEMTSLIEGQVAEMRHSLETIRKNIFHRSAIESRFNGIIRQWADVAMVMDRLFFAIYIIIITLSLIFLFPRPKY